MLFFFSFSGTPSDYGLEKNPCLVNQQVSDLMSNGVTAQLKSPLSDPFGREARVTSALTSPLSVPNGREASLTADQSPLSKPYGWEASLTAVKNPPSVYLTVPSHSREVCVIVAKSCECNHFKHNENHIYKKLSKKNVKIKKDSIEITKTHEKNIKSKKEKIEKDSTRITKTHEKNIKSTKCLKTKNYKKKNIKQKHLEIY